MEKSYSQEIKKLKKMNKNNNFLFNQILILMKSSKYLIFLIFAMLNGFIVVKDGSYLFPNNIITWIGLMVISIPMGLIFYTMINILPKYENKEEFLKERIRMELRDHNWRNIYQILVLDTKDLMPERIEKILLKILFYKIALIKNNEGIKERINNKGLIIINNQECILNKKSPL